MDIHVWLRELGLADHAAAFAANDIDWEILPELTSEDLRDIGIESVGHRRKLLKAIAALSDGPQPSPDVQPQPVPAEHLAERRQVSVLFCDMVGSTSLSAQIDPEDMREIQRMYQDAVAAAMSANGGHVANYVGDGVVVYFGWPQATENQASQAVRAGLAALEKVAQITVSDARVTLSARVGIATGQVVVGDLSGENSHQAGAISGETPNRAARLQDLAEPGQLIVDALTQRLLKPGFELCDLGLVELKGLDRNVQAFRVGNEYPELGELPFADSPGDAMEMVGRDGDDQLIKDRWRQALAGDGQAILLTGEAGIGKSRMVRQLVQHAAGDGRALLRFQCAQNLSNAALHPIGRMIESLAAFDRQDTTDMKFAKLEAWLGTSREAGCQRSALLGSVIGLPVEQRYPPLGMSPQRHLEEILATVVELIINHGNGAPLLIVFEDLHWADPTSVELVGRLISEIGTRQTMLMATCRTEFTAPWPSYPHLTQLKLNRIGQAACDALIDQVTGGKPLDARIKTKIIEKADGIPLFVEEITKTVLEAGFVIETETGFVPVDDETELGIPATIKDALTARLDRFAPVKNVAQIGACIGRDFSYDLLKSIADVPETELKEALLQLVRAEIVFSRGAPPLSTYLFKHALLRDAAYDSLLRNRKRQYHSRIVTYLEGQNPLDAVRAAVNAAAAGEPRKAAEFFLQAGRTSMASGTFGEAISQLRLGLSESARLPEGQDRDRMELDLRVALGTAEMAVKGWAADEIVEVLNPAIPIAKSLGDDLALGLSLFSIWIYHATRAEMETSQLWLAEMDQVALSNDSPDLQMVADTAASMNYFWIGDYEKAALRRVRTLRNYRADQHGHLVHYMNHDPYATVLQWAGATQLWVQGYPEQALAAIDKAIAHARTLESPFAVVFALTLGSLALIEMGEAERMLTQCAEASAICDEIGLPFIRIVSCESLRGRALVSLHKDSEGVETLLQSTALWEAVGGRTTYGEYTSRLAAGLGRLGRFEEALEQSGKSLAHQSRTRETWYYPESLRNHAVLLLSLPEPRCGEAIDYLIQACALAKRQGARSFELRATTTLAAHLAETGERAAALSSLAPVLEQFTEGFDTPDLIAARRLLDRLLVATAEDTKPTA